MSGTKTNRTDLENRFKKGMYPTENDFANVFASYVHKDDAITLSQITLEEGGDNLGEVIDSKADKQTLETFVREVETVLETTRDSETGAITNSAISSLAQRITDAENDIASAANAVETNEDSIAKILTILGKQNGESVSELASRFSALSGDYATVFAFVSKVKTFLESADVADTTINRWQEIEAFLQGITDTETLTGLLQQMKQEILAEIPEPQTQPTGNYLELVEDLDAYTDAPDGKIVKYVGQTNEKYTRGFDYERKVSEEKSFAAGSKVLSFDHFNIVDDIVLDGNYYEDPTINVESCYAYTYAKCKQQLQDNGDGTFSKIACSDNIIICRTRQAKPIPESYVIINGIYHKLPAELELASCSYQGALMRNYEYSDYVFVPTANLWVCFGSVESHMSSGYYKTFINPETGDIIQYDPLGSSFNDQQDALLTTADGIKVYLVNKECVGHFSDLTDAITVGGASWQLIPSFNVIN